MNLLLFVVVIASIISFLALVNMLLDFFQGNKAIENGLVQVPVELTNCEGESYTVLAWQKKN